MGPGASGGRGAWGGGGGGWKCGCVGVGVVAGCVRGGGGGWGWGGAGAIFDQHWQPCRLRDEEWEHWQPCRSRDKEWDQEPWLHEKHGGVRGGLGEREGRMGRGTVVRGWWG